MKYRIVMARGWYHVEKYNGVLFGWGPIDSCGDAVGLYGHKEFQTYKEAVVFAREMFGFTGKLISKGVVL